MWDPTYNFPRKYSRCNGNGSLILYSMSKWCDGYPGGIIGGAEFGPDAH
jgi:hypothetical protein